MRTRSRKVVLVAAAAAEFAAVYFTPRVVLINGERMKAARFESSEFASSLDLPSIAAYTLGIVTVAVLLWFALAPEE